MTLMTIGRAIVPSLFFLIISGAFASENPSTTKRTDASVAPALRNSCRSLSLIDFTETVTERLGTELRKAIETFEQSIQQADESKFQTVLHPALQLSPAKRHNLFVGAFTDFGLDKPKLVRSYLFELDIQNQANPIAECSAGKIRGVSGPTRQWALIHTILDAAEQVRFMELFAPVPESIEKRHGTKFGVGLVMFHTQSFSHERKAPVKLLEEARKWSELGSPLSGWFLAESAARLLDANPYFEPIELFEAKKVADEMLGRGVKYTEWQRELARDPTLWRLIELTPVYQATGVEPGIRFQASKVLEPSKLPEGCLKNVRAVLKVLPSLRDRFHGVECLPYGIGEDLTKPPVAGSVFLKWNELK